VPTTKKDKEEEGEMNETEKGMQLRGTLTRRRRRGK
jgi:hypothetical protein